MGEEKRRKKVKGKSGRGKLGKNNGWKGQRNRKK
jgi:hypothetical protein